MNLRHIAVKREKYELYFILVLYTFIKVKSNKRGKVMSTEDKTYKSDEVFLVVFPLLN